MPLPRCSAACFAVFWAFGASAANAQFGLYFDLAELDGTNAKLFMGELRYSCTGIATTTGDLNGDGLPDLIIPASCSGRLSFPADNFPGTVYVVFGGSFFDQVVTMGMEELDAPNGFAIEGPAPRGYFGFWVLSGFDWNADGIDDLAVGAPGLDVGPSTDAGRVFVIFGHPAIGAAGSFDLATLDGSNGFVIDGLAYLEWLGWSLAAGDFNGDAWPDLAIGAVAFMLPGRSDAGRVFVVFGGPGVGSSGSIDLRTLDGTNGFIANGIATDDLASVTLANAGDFNEDGFEDLAIGAAGADVGGLTDAGQSYVLFGGPDIGGSGVIELADLDGTNGFSINGPAPDVAAGYVSAGGDVNGDTVTDLMVGQSAGGSVVFGGRDVGTSGAVEIATLGWPDGVRFFRVYNSVGGPLIGDTNDDGLAEVTLPMWDYDPLGRPNAGSVGVVFGDPGLGIDGPIRFDELDGTNGFYVYGDEPYRLLMAAYPLGDLNRDGVGDFAVYGRVHRPFADFADGIFVVFGRSRFALGDLDRDGDVDNSDFFAFMLCYNGSSRPPAHTCSEGLDADLDGDGDVDLDDFGIFAANYTGAE